VFYHSVVKKERDAGPRLRVEQESKAPGSRDQWVVGWRLQNLGVEPLEILTARCPHGKFRSKERELSPAPKLLPGESARVELAVACGEPPGTVVENAFLILRVLWRGKPWQVFARFTVVFDAEGAPESRTEHIAAQPVGFSQPLTPPSPSPRGRGRGEGA
jgi:hypothetical protein